MGPEVSTRLLRADTLGGEKAGNHMEKRVETVATFEEAVDKMYAAGIKNLHRPNDPWDTYYTLGAVREWARRTAKECIAKGTIVVKPIRTPQIERLQA